MPAAAGRPGSPPTWTGSPTRSRRARRRPYAPDLGSPWGGRGACGTGSAYGPEGMDLYLATKSVFLPAVA